MCLFRIRHALLLGNFMHGYLLEQNLKVYTISLHHCPVSGNDHIEFAEVFRIIQSSTSMMKMNTKHSSLCASLDFSLPLMNQSQRCNNQCSLVSVGREGEYTLTGSSSVGRLWTMSAILCIVFPKPISSASNPPPTVLTVFA